MKISKYPNALATSTYKSPKKNKNRHFWTLILVFKKTGFVII